MIEFADVTGDQRAERAAVTRELLGQLGALVAHQLVERAHLHAERVVGVFGLADHLGDQGVDGDVQRFAGLVAAGQHLGGEAVAGVVDLAGEVGAAQVEFDQQRVARVLQRVVHLLGAVGDAFDNDGGLLLELAGDALDALVQHVVDAIGEVDEFVVHMAGLEIQAGGQPLAGVEHRARGLGAGFLEAVEQVAAALAERQDHVVAGRAERIGDVRAAFFQGAGDALGDFVNARGDRVGNQRDVMAQIDLHAGNGAAHLFGLADQIIALMGDVLQQRADAHFVIGIGAFQRRHFVGDQRFQFAGARDRAFDAIAHRRDFAADRLTHGHHGLAGNAFRLGETHRDLRHRLRDHAQLLAAPGEMGEEEEQHHRREEQRRKAGEHQHAAALAHGGLQRRQEADGEQTGAKQPDAGEDAGESVDIAGGAASLNRLEQLADGLAIIIGRAPRQRLFGQLVEAGALGHHPRLGRKVSRRRRCFGCGSVSPGRAGLARSWRRVDVQGFLNRRQRNFGGIFGFLGIVGHVQFTPLFYASGGSFAKVASRPPVLAARQEDLSMPPACPPLQQTSYWLGDANEMVAVKTFLIIVNGGSVRKKSGSESHGSHTFLQNIAEIWTLRRVSTARIGNHFRDLLCAAGRRRRRAGPMRGADAGNRTGCLDAVAFDRAG